ncbi:MAG: glycosyltransferase family 4 protein [Acidimicrobiales bacterium]
MGVHVTQLLRNIVALRPEGRYLALVASLRQSAILAAELQGIDPQGRLEPRTVRLPGSILDRVVSGLHVPPMSFLLRAGYDVFHLMWLRSDPPVPSSKLVVTMHDTVSLEWPEHEAPLPRTAGKVLRRAAAVITVSEHARRKIVDAFAPDPARVHVIPNGCDTSTFRPDHDPAEVTATLAGLGVPRPFLLSVGGQTPRKNLPRLVDAFALSRRRLNLPHTLVHVGPSRELRSEVVAAVTRSGAADAFLNLGYVTDTAMAHLYSAADALLFPSIAEGFGLPVVEALASGTPVLTSAISSLPEVAGGAATLVDPLHAEAIAEGIASLLQEAPAQQEERRRRGILHARTFSWKDAARRHLQVYDAVAAGAA